MLTWAGQGERAVPALPKKAGRNLSDAFAAARLRVLQSWLQAAVYLPDAPPPPGLAAPLISLHR